MQLLLLFGVISSMSAACWRVWLEGLNQFGFLLLPTAARPGLSEQPPMESEVMTLSECLLALKWSARMTVLIEN